MTMDFLTKCQDFNLGLIFILLKAKLKFHKRKKEYVKSFFFVVTAKHLWMKCIHLSDEFSDSKLTFREVISNKTAIDTPKIFEKSV